jgi:hypothetical protein
MADIPYVPIIDNSTYANKKSSEEIKKLRLKDLGIESDSKGFLTISDTEAFISGLGLSDAYAERLMSKGVEFKNFDVFKQFIDTAVESGNTTKEQGFYDDIFSEDGNLQSDAVIQKSSALNSEESDKAADKAFNVKPKPVTPAPQNQAQAARPTLAQPDNGKSAFARAAANAEPAFINRANGNARWANPVKAQLENEAKRRLQNELAELKKSEKATKRAGEVDEILNNLNDQYRQLYANTPDAEGNARSAEDWDAMGRDQKIKMVQNYNKNRLLPKQGEEKSLDKPAGEITGQKINAQVAPQGSMEDLTTPREFNNVTNEFEVPQEPREFDSRRNTFRTPEEFAASRVPKLEPESFEPQVRPPESPNIDLDGIQDQVDTDAAQAKRMQRRRKPTVPDDAVHTKHPNVPDDSHSGIYATNPDVQKRSFDSMFPDSMDSQPGTPVTDDTMSTDIKAPVITPPNINLQDIERDSRYKLPAYSQQQSIKSEPITPPNRNLQDIERDSRYKLPAYSQQQSIKSEPIAPAPAQSPKLPPADPFKQDAPQKTYETEGPKRMVKVRNSDGSYTYTTYEDQKRRAQEYAKRQMRNSPRSLLGDTHSEDMRKLYPSLNMDNLTRDVDTTNYNQQRKQFDEGYASRMYPQTAANPTPRTDTMMRNINAMPKRQQLDVINSFRKHRGEDELYNPFS